ncbi:sulfite exporter TauE/SafE family protein [Methanocorpusculum sp. GPch4]|uniref:sulfite exporter TauE/SafE family protein n=1 Tax=Methanocorpusculum sp. GPch4 TaxID=2527877 RepID=UPI0014334529|nr:sulfite exporter TauE/SafE family protein [Methanocorpusculum sp. GPch4]
MDPIFICILIGTGLLAGFMSGLLGVGGGFLYAPVMFFVLLGSGVPGDIAILVAFGTSLAAAFPTVLTGAAGHTRKGNVVWRDALIMGVCGILTGFIGGTAATYLPVQILTILFGVMLIIGAIRLVTCLPSGTGERMAAPLAGGIGGAAGFLSGLLGIGGGTVLVPLMVLLGKFSMKKAAATSSAAIVFITLGGILSYLINGFSAGADLSSYGFYLFGYIDVMMWAILVITAIPMVIFAVRISGHVPDVWLRRIFFILMLVIAFQMLISG